MADLRRQHRSGVPARVLRDRLQERLPLSSYRRPLLGTGICGGLSAFSTMQVEILKMTSAHDWGLAAGYAAASITAGYAALCLPTAMVRRVRVGR